MDKEKPNSIQQVQSTNEKLNVASSRLSSGSSSPNNNQIPLFSVHPTSNDTFTIGKF